VLDSPMNILMVKLQQVEEKKIADLCHDVKHY
jgi:hypothetical protein